MIPGVEIIELTTHIDDRGFFREILKSDQILKFGQWSMSYMHQGLIKGFHIHQVQTDYWFVVSGTIRAVLVDQRNGTNSPIYKEIDGWSGGGVYCAYEEYLLGDHQLPKVLVIPPGVAHGLKVLQGPAVLMYITSEEYNPQDEGRIPYNSLGYDWAKEMIK